MQSFDLGHWKCKTWPCSYLWHAQKGIFLKFYKYWVSLCDIIRVKRSASCGNVKYSSSVHILRSPWTIALNTLIPNLSFVVKAKKRWIFDNRNSPNIEACLVRSTFCSIAIVVFRWRSRRNRKKKVSVHFPLKKNARKP